MSRKTGYQVTIKAFVESPKDNFEKMAAAAVMMATITKSKTLPAEFLELATIVDVSAKFGSVQYHETLPLDPDGNPPSNEAPPTGDEPGSETQSDETAVEGVRKAGRSRG